MANTALLEITDGVATLTLNRPAALNALSVEMMQDLNAAARTLVARKDVAVVVIAGAGEHFMAGGDLKDFAAHLHLSPEARLVTFKAMIEQWINPTVEILQGLPQPVVAKVRGAVAGAGVSIAAACDLIMAEEDAFFTLAYCHIGTTPDGSGRFHLPRAIGVKKAMEMMLLGDRHSARQMADMGLVNFVVPGDELDAACAKLAGRLAKGPTFAYGQGKRLMYRSLENEFESQLQMEAEMFASCVVRKDFREGVTAFVEKRKANFTGD